MAARLRRIGTLGEHFGGSNVSGAPSLFGMSLGEALPILLFDLYAAGGDPVPVELFYRRVREAVNERFGCIVDDLAGDVEQRLWRRDVTAVLDTLELLGAVHLTESHDHDMLTELAGRDDPDPTLVALTPIGLWGVREILLEQGVPAPLVGELAEEDVEYVCVRLAGARREVAEAELTAWVAARSPRAAADELARLLRRTDEPRTGRWRSTRCAATRTPGQRADPGRGAAARGEPGASDRPARDPGTGRGGPVRLWVSVAANPGTSAAATLHHGDRRLGRVPAASSLLTMGWTAQRPLSR